MQTFGTRPHSTTWPVVSSALNPSQKPRPISVSSTSTSLSSSSSHSPFSLRRDVLIRDLGIENLIVPKARRPKFILHLEIHDLNNVPLVSGYAYVKWHVEGSTRADARGRTARQAIKDHRVSWGYKHEGQVRLTMGRGDMLQEQCIVFEVNQEYSGARQRIQLGTIKLNLAEYAGVEKETRRYLMQESKINSTMKIGISLTQVGGDHNWRAPSLKGAQVFSGIAGIIGSGEQQREQDDARSVTSLSTKTREAGATQDMYRSTLMASWQLQAGELNAEECIEDIFAGGNGWTPNPRSRKPKSVLFDTGSSRREGSDSDSMSGRSSTLNTPTTTAPPPILIQRVPSITKKKPKDSDALSVLTTTSTVRPQRNTNGKIRSRERSRHIEVDEMDAREDFVSWRMSAASTVR